MGCDISKIRDELISELYSSGMSPKAILAHKKNIEKYIYELKMTAELIETENIIASTSETINNEKIVFKSTIFDKKYKNPEFHKTKYNTGKDYTPISENDSYDKHIDLAILNSPSILNIGTKEQYKDYLNTIFSDSEHQELFSHRGSFAPKEDSKLTSEKTNLIKDYLDSIGFEYEKERDDLISYSIENINILTDKELGLNNDDKVYGVISSYLDDNANKYETSKTINFDSENDLYEISIPKELYGKLKELDYKYSFINKEGFDKKFTGTGDGRSAINDDSFTGFSFSNNIDNNVDSKSYMMPGYIGLPKELDILIAKLNTKNIDLVYSGVTNVDKSIDTLIIGNISNEIIVKDNSQIHILGSDNDIEQFKEYVKNDNKSTSETSISGSGPKEWRSEENVTEKFNFGYQEIGEFIDTLVKATGDMTARTDSNGYHQNLKTLVDLIKDSMSENNFKKAIEIVGINTNDEFSNATYEENTDKDAKAMNHSGEEMNLGGRLTIRYGKDYKEEMKDESGNPLDSYKNTFSGFRELVLHEVLHAMIDEAMNLDKALYAKVSAIQKQYAKKVTLESMSKSMKARSGEEPTANNLMQMKDIIEYLNASPVEFLTYTMTNPIVYDIMESDTEAAKIDLVDSRTRGSDSDKKNAFQKIMDTIINIINKVYTIKTFGSKIKDGKVQPKTGLDMIQELTVELMLKNIALEKINSGFRSKIVDGAIFGNYDLGGALNISSKYKKFNEQIKDIGGKAFKKMLDKKDSSGLTGKLEQTASWFNRFDFIKDQKENGNIRIFSDIMNTIVEDTTSEDGGAASFYQLIRNIKKNRDNGKVEMTQVARNKVDDLWKDMSKEQRESATFMLQADWKGLGLNLDEYANIVNNDSAIDFEIDKLKKEINVVEYNEGAKHLGFYIVHGVSKSPELMRNADMIFNRAYDSKRRTLVDPKFEKQYVEKIDKLASYYALKYMDKNIRKEIASSIAKDKELVEATSNMYYSYYDKQADKFRETGLHKYMEKGGMRKSSEVDMKFEVLPEDEIRTGRFTAHDKVRLDKATTEAMNDGKEYWLVVSRDFSPSRTQGGFDDIHIIDKGLGLRSIIGGNELITHDAEFDSFINKRIEKAPHFLNKEHDDSLESMIALDNQLVAAFDIYGNVIDYEVPISELDRKDKGRLNNDIASTLSQTISHIHSKENAVKNNGVFAKMLVQESDNNAGKPGYVLLRPSTIDEIKSGNKHKYDEEWAMIPNYIQKMILARDSNGNNTRDGLWVKEGRINNIIGYKDMTIANLKMFGKDLNEYPDMQRALQVIEYFWKQMSSRYKEIVVKLFPAVVWANITSNMWVAMRHGIGPMEYAKGFVRNWTNLTTYLELSEELIKSQLDLDSGVVKTDAKILELKKQMKNNSFHRLIEDGQFNSIMEDLDSTGLTKKSHIEDYFDIAAKKGGKLGGQTKTVVENLYIGRNTAIHKNIEKLTVFNDIINRSIIMERMMQDLDSIDGLEPEVKNAKVQDILNYVDQLFVNYSYLDNKVVKYLNDVNLVTFTKYFFRALKANISMMSRYPLASLGFEGYDEFIYDVSDSLDQYGNPIDSFMNRVMVTPVEVASELIIPNSIGIFIR